MTEPPETSELLAFVQTVDARSLSRAAVELGVPRITVSRRLSRLEERLGVRLLRRTTRRLALTDAGEELYARARAILSSVAEAEAAVRRSDGVIRGLLRVALPPPTSDDGLHAMLLAFVDRYPEVQLQVHASAQHLDLIGSGYDVAIRAGLAIDPGLVGRKLASAPLFAVASPAYLERFGVPTLPTLRDHRCIVGFARGEHPVTAWPLRAGGNVRVTGWLTTNEVTLQRAAALDGRGIALLADLLIRDELASGALVPVLPEVGADGALVVVYPERELLPPVVRAFVDHVAKWWKERA